MLLKEKEAKRIQEEQKQQQLHIEQQGIACKKQLEHERVQRIESLRREAEERWKIDKERILKNDKEYMAYQKRRKKDFAILILSAIPFASFSILFLAGENETIPKDKFFVEFITYFVSFLICAIIFSLGVRRVFGNFNPEESTDAKKEQYIVRHIKEKNAPKQQPAIMHNLLVAFLETTNDSQQQ